MPLRDQFHAPLFPSNPWESFLTVWAVTIGGRLNGMLPGRYLAAVHAPFGRHVQAEVAETELLDAPGDKPLAMPAIFPDDLEVQILDQDEDARLVAVVELISPRNKD